MMALSEREAILEAGGDVTCTQCFARGDGRSFSPPYVRCDACRETHDADGNEYGVDIGTTCGICNGLTYTDDDGDCEECGEPKL